MRREFSYLTVTPVVRATGGHREIALDDRNAPAPRRAAAPHQRDLVRTSLLRCPPSDRR